MLINNYFNFAKFFSPSYLFARVPSSLSRQFMTAWLVVGLALLTIGVIAKFYAVSRRSLARPLIKWWRRLGTLAVLAGLSSLLLLFFRYERSPFLGMRVLMLLWLIIVLADFARLLWRRKAQVPSAISEEERQRRLRKYLP